MKHNHNDVEMWNKKKLAYFSAGLRHVCPRCLYLYVEIYIYISCSILLLRIFAFVCVCVCAVFVPAFVLVFEVSFAAKTRTWRSLCECMQTPA